jgi:hypothetical protein
MLAETSREEEEETPACESAHSIHLTFRSRASSAALSSAFTTFLEYYCSFLFTTTSDVLERRWDMYHIRSSLQPPFLLILSENSKPPAQLNFRHTRSLDPSYQQPAQEVSPGSPSRLPDTSKVTKSRAPYPVSHPT